MFDFKQITLFSLEKRLSKHKMTIFSKKLGGHGHFRPPWLRLWQQCQPCSIALGKFILLVFMTKVAKKACQMSKEKACLAFDCKYMS